MKFKKSNCNKNANNFYQFSLWLQTIILKIIKHWNKENNQAITIVILHNMFLLKVKKKIIILPIMAY